MEKRTTTDRAYELLTLLDVVFGSSRRCRAAQARGASVNVINDAPRALMTSELLSKVEASPVYLDLPVFLAF